MSTTSTVTVQSAYGQIFLREIGDLAPAFTNSYLAGRAYEGAIVLWTVKQTVELPIAVTLHDSRPEPLDASWQDAVEFSITASDETVVSGYDPMPTDVSLDLQAGLTYRVRYAMADVDRAYTTPHEATERVSIDFWQEAPTPSALLRQDSEFGRLLLAEFTRHPSMYDD